MGPLDRVARVQGDRDQPRAGRPIPAAGSYYGLQQIRWLPENIADNPRDA